MISRRQLLTTVAAAGAGTPLFHRALTGLLQEQENAEDLTITEDLVKKAEWISGTELSEAERESVAASLQSGQASRANLRNRTYAFDDLPAVHFQPLSGVPPRPASPQRVVEPIGSFLTELPSTEEEIAYLTVAQLAAFLQQGKISSVELTKIYLRRLEKYNPLLNCVVTLTTDLALRQAKKADDEMAAGKYRGPLHGIPWGAKDLVAVPGYPTTWGIPQFKTRELEQQATVATRLEEAGAVLVAKLSLGAIAMGDRWFNGRTRNPWDAKRGSSGSSAGSASATVAGLVGFSIGTETLGSILSPSMTCGASGLRPSFGRVSRHGCMSLCWTMDKIGAITRSAQDCALVFAAMHGADGHDPTVHDWPFEWPNQPDFSSLRVGYQVSRRDEDLKQDELFEKNEPLKILHELGCQLVPLEWPDSLKGGWVLADAINIEGAAAFDEMFQNGQTEGWNSWVGSFASAHFYTAIDYVRMMRMRRQMQFEFERLMQSYDVLVDADDWLVANVTGHPAVIVPFGFDKRGKKRFPGSVKFTGHLNDDARLLAFAHAFQEKVTSHLERPPLDQQLAKKKEADSKKKKTP